jgi:hypothetical protein
MLYQSIHASIRSQEAIHNSFMCVQQEAIHRCEDLVLSANREEPSSWSILSSCLFISFLRRGKQNKRIWGRRNRVAPLVFFLGAWERRKHHVTSRTTRAGTAHKDFDIASGTTVHGPRAYIRCGGSWARGRSICSQRALSLDGRRRRWARAQRDESRDADGRRPIRPTPPHVRIVDLWEGWRLCCCASDTVAAFSRWLVLLQLQLMLQVC